MSDKPTCQYCGIELAPDRRFTCEWCSRIVQEANCEGFYIVDTAQAVRKRDDLTPEARRIEIQAAFDRLATR